MLRGLVPFAVLRLLPMLLVMAATTAFADGLACVFDGSAIKNGATVVAFERAEIASSEKCKSEVRRCTKGKLSGTYNEPTCNEWRDCPQCKGGRAGAGSCCGIDNGSGWRRHDRHCVGDTTVDRECGRGRGGCAWVGCRPMPGWRKKS